MRQETLDTAIKWAIEAIKNAHAGISGTRVGACAIAKNRAGDYGVFSGCNIELANSNGWHAEEVALMKAISEGHPYIECMVVTSGSDAHAVACCGYCLQNISYANLDCRIIVVNLEGKIKIDTTARKRQGENGYLGKGKLEL